MSWNEPGGDKKDPWSGRNDQNSPPDLDEVVRNLQEKLGALFGGGSNGGGNRTSGSSMRGAGWVAGGALVLWSLSGFYTVDEGTRGVVTRFGAYVGTSQPGLNWHVPAPIEQVQVINVEQQRFIEVGYRSGGGQAMGSVPKEAMMLTKDENIVDVRLAVQYQVKDAKDYAFNVLDPASTLKQVTESVQRGVIGRSDMDFVLTEGRSEIVQEIKSEIQSVMDAYRTGILITSVNLQDAQPPEQVQGAFEDAIKAREDKQRLINEAEAYANDVVPKARGAASRIVQESEGYKEKVIAKANGDVSRFSQLLTEYKKAPGVTKQRMYIETMEQVLGRASNVLVDVKDGGNVMYLPLDKLGVGRTEAAPDSVTNHEPVAPQPTLPTVKESKTDVRINSRERDVRGRYDGK
ncbi:FtsH protease activity modulator HflK [Methylomonas sp. MED-D]|uniref:Protein HflK n=1 Tax=Methylomonas koyamae TaxID=702114 RepID=A0A177NSX0_9GAMM|nr:MULTISPECIES: FtsH protease activity modulator HflK [Methylomonas]NJA04781.1 FtsH protease activity modulator HflK [Methylococcaceae bacterium WWC4]MDT4328911.1 FtsH protease activity modulator HflK [Methylomonas sp. MV1]OAI21095.1 protease modulator HflK [Methylomonas koyamae]OHX35200.1 HflK protein [Methylomonas sp. LWB]WGS87870.1 FtsH protease activity modulator HflK [Methylomonas sp. UP202]